MTLNARQGLSLLWALIMSVPIAQAVTVYDCSPSARLSYTLLDLTGPQICPSPKDDYSEPIPVKVQVLHTDTAVPVEAYQCAVTVTKMVVPCGFTSITYAHSHPMWNRNIELTVPECSRAIEYGKYRYDGKEHNVSLNQDNSFTYYPQTEGVTYSGRCPTVNAQVIVDGLIYEKVYVEVHLSVKLRRIPGTLDTANGVVSWANGIKANYASRVISDAVEGTMTWPVKEHACTSTVSQLYKGDAIARRRHNDTYQDSIILVENEDTKQFGGFLIKKQIVLCESTCLTTQVEGIIVCIILPFHDAIPDAKFNPSFSQLKADLYTRITHLHLTTNMRMNSRFESIQFDLCRTEQKTHFNKLQAIAMRNPYALLDVYGRGHSIEVAGAVAYITKCQPREASIVAYPNCTTEIPLRLRSSNGTELVGDMVFADPLTWILKDYGTIIPCSDIHPVRWQVAGTWYCSHKTGAVASTCTDSPGKLNTTTNIRNNKPIDNDFTRGMGMTMFTPEMIRQHQKYRLAYHSRGAVVQKVTNAATGNTIGNHHSYLLGSPLSDDDVSTLTTSLGGFFFPLFPLVGEAWFTVVAVMLAFSMFRIFATFIFRGYLLYKEREGCGWWMLGVIFGATFHAIRAPYLVAKQAVCSAMSNPDPREMNLWLPSGVTPTPTRSRSSSVDRRVRLRLPSRHSPVEPLQSSAPEASEDPLAVSYSSLKKKEDQADAASAEQEIVVRPGESAEYLDELGPPSAGEEPQVGGVHRRH